MHAAVIADDLTGAADTGVQFAHAGYRTAVAFRGALIPPAEDLDAVALDTDSRAMPAGFAAKRVLDAAHAVRRARIVYKKLDHAGENGLFGTEDMERIAPAVEEAREKGIETTGPWPPDTVLMRARRGEFDVVVVQYHDQGHIPVKLMGFDTGVNVTAGLPFFRTSVDHGTAFDIAGTGQADHASMRAALQLARRLASAEDHAQERS